MEYGTSISIRIKSCSIENYAVLWPLLRLPAIGSPVWVQNLVVTCPPKPVHAEREDFRYSFGETAQSGEICMSRKRHTPEQIISKLREAEVLLSQGQSVPAACKTIEVSEQRCGMNS